MNQSTLVATGFWTAASDDVNASPFALMKVQLRIGEEHEIEVLALIDTGAEHTLFDLSLAKSTPRGRAISTHGVGVETTSFAFEASMRIGRAEHSGEFGAIALGYAQPRYAAIIGMDFLKHYRLELCRRSELVAIWA